LRLISAATGSRRARRRATYSSLAGSLITRFAWILAGHTSARDYRLPLEIPEQAGQQQPSVPRLPEEAERDERLAV
jgi:hypothetical protein